MSHSNDRSFFSTFYVDISWPDHSKLAWYAPGTVYPQEVSLKKNEGASHLLMAYIVVCQWGEYANIFTCAKASHAVIVLCKINMILQIGRIGFAIGSPLTTLSEKLTESTTTMFGGGVVEIRKTTSTDPDRSKYCCSCVYT